jgi:hypothetical protein
MASTLAQSVSFFMVANSSAEQRTKPTSFAMCRPPHCKIRRIVTTRE